MLTLKKIFSLTARQDLERFSRAVNVKVMNIKIGVSKSTGLRRFICRTQTPEKKALGFVLQKYVTTVDFKDNKHVRISCSCPDFVFSGAEYNLAQKGAAILQYGNGQPPEAHKQVYCCKHVVRFVDVMVNNGKLNNNFELVP